jgi:hypothetical protein
MVDCGHDEAGAGRRNGGITVVEIGAALAGEMTINGSLSPAANNLSAPEN